MNLVFEVTPSFICSIIRKSHAMKSELDVIAAFEKLSLLSSDVLSDEHVTSLDDNKTERRLLFDNIDSKLLPLAHDLYGLTEVEEPDEAAESEDKSSDSSAFPLNIAGPPKQDTSI